MRLPVLSLLVAGYGATALSTSGVQPLGDANHIFNAIHDSMRQFGSSLHHNGMSFFLASVPEGIQLYHGNASPEYLKEIGWMAFEPEHAMVFARPARPGQRENNQDNDAQQQPLTSDSVQDADDEADQKPSGYLHTYKTAKPLRLLYIDGTSAGKSQIGTLDSQDRILFNDTIQGGVSMEEGRARSVCRLAEDEWGGRLDGVIRMAAGFEIILCKPEANLLPVRVMPVEKQKHEENKQKGFRGRGQDKGKDKKDKKGHHNDKARGKHHDKKGKKGSKHAGHNNDKNQAQQDPDNGNGNGNDNTKPRGKPKSLLYAITSRFNGIGGDRVVLNYNNFMTAYTYDLDLFPSTNSSGTEKEKRSPRLQHTPSSDLKPIRKDLTTLILEHDVNDNKPNWQSIADLIVAKYAPILRDLAPRRQDDKLTSRREHQHKYKQSSMLKISEILSPFASPSKDETLSLCASQFVSIPNTNSTLAHRALYSISKTICSTLLNLENEEDEEMIHASIAELMKYLDWTTWKECRGCKGDEFCAVPIWPNGSEEDFERPRCERFEDGWGGRSGYWGGVWH
ncbi:hypothetical protein BDW69DRAFT_187495 [Aspergillus filifer]